MVAGDRRAQTTSGTNPPATHNDPPPTETPPCPSRDPAACCKTNNNNNKESRHGRPASTSWPGGTLQRNPRLFERPVIWATGGTTSSTRWQQEQHQQPIPVAVPITSVATWVVVRSCPPHVCLIDRVKVIINLFCFAFFKINFKFVDLLVFTFGNFGCILAFMLTL